MKKIVILSILLIVSLSPKIYSQWGWFQVNSGVSTHMNGIYSYYSIGWAVGNNGLILKTTNFGENWFTQTSGTNANLKSVAFIGQYYSTPRYGYIAGANGTILISHDTGRSWINVSSGVTVELNCIYPLHDTLSVIAVGQNGTILKSTNMGTTWLQKQSSTTANLKSIAQSFGDYICVVGQGGIVLVSSDLGENWFQCSSGTTNDLNSVIQYTDYYSNLLAVGNNGTILKSSSFGFSWQVVTSGTNQNLLSISSVNNVYPLQLSYQHISGANGTILASSDSGSTWQSQYSPVALNLNSINFFDINSGYAVGNNGSILKNVSNHYYIDSRKLDANTISALYMNDGSFNSRIGFEWPKGSGKYAVYQSGLCIGALVGSDTLLATAMYDAEFYPGYVDNNGMPFGKNDSNYRIYRLTYGINNFDRQWWPNLLLGNSNQGAPVYFDSLSSSWKPLDFGTQTMYCVFTDAYPESHMNYFGGRTAPLKADVKRLSFAIDVSGGLGNVIFSKFTVINRSTSTWQNAYITIWSDDDIGDYWNDKLGCDSALQLGFTYNATNTDTSYGAAPPAVGFVILRGALNYTGNNNDTVRICNNKMKTFVTGYKDLGMSVFNYSKNADLYYHDPDNYVEMYRLMKGLYVNGSNIIHPNGYVTKLVFSGDPVSGTGWNLGTQGDVRCYISTGPVNMNPGDTQITVTAQVIARGNSNLNSITVMRQYVSLIKQFYDSCYSPFPIKVTSSGEIAKKFRLYQNFPNPFNPKSKIKFEIANTPLTPPFGVGGINSVGKQAVRLVIYDVLGREVAVLVNELLKPGAYEVEFDGTNYPSGVYFYKIMAGDFVETRKMVLIK